MDSLVFDSLELITVPVKLGGKWYALCEGSEAAVRAYQTAGMAGFEMDLSKLNATSPESIKESLKDSIKGFDPSKATSGTIPLLAACIKDCEYDEAKEAFTHIGDPCFTVTQIEGWSPRVVGPLFERLKSITELGLVPSANPTQVVGQNSTTI